MILRDNGETRACRTLQTIAKAVAFTLREMGSHWRVLSSGSNVFCLYFLKDHSGCCVKNRLGAEKARLEAGRPDRRL